MASRMPWVWFGTGLAVVGLVSGAGAPATYSAWSDSGTTRFAAGAGIWAPDPPARCGPLDAYAEVVWGTAGDDRFTGDDRPRIYLGLEGDDRLVAGTAADCLVGGPGRDRLVGNGSSVLVADRDDTVTDQPRLEPPAAPTTDDAPAQTPPGTPATATRDEPRDPPPTRDGSQPVGPTGNQPGDQPGDQTDSQTGSQTGSQGPGRPRPSGPATPAPSAPVAPGGEADTGAGGAGSGAAPETAQETPKSDPVG